MYATPPSSRDSQALHTGPDCRFLAAPSWSFVAWIDACTDTRYNTIMIRSFKHRGLKRLYQRGDRSRISAEQLARIVAFTGVQQVCARCKLTISEGDDAVCCPQCGVWHHEIKAEERNCWSYSDRCTLCNQLTDLDSAEFHWTPEGL